ncbi:MAG: ECF-type riboflavin transporter substrate-binding protein [Eubacteriaceae bacterium]|nr:ECF-type riboflavin transporter substrate-binding protein [Eubacteriaceae bacterium]
MKKSPVINIVATGIGAALFFVLARYVAIPSPVPNTNISIQYGLLSFMSCLFGVVPGALIAFVGHALSDFSFGWGVWWSWVIASGVAGVIMGFAAKKIDLAGGNFTTKDMILFNVYQGIAHLVAWVVVAPILDIVIYAEPVNKVFVQGLFAAGANIVTTAIVGTLLCLAYAKSRPAGGSLKKED